MVQCALACADSMVVPLCWQTIFCLNFTLVTCLINSFTSGGVWGGSGKGGGLGQRERGGRDGGEE